MNTYYASATQLKHIRELENWGNRRGQHYQGKAGGAIIGSMCFMTVGHAAGGMTVVGVDLIGV